MTKDTSGLKYSVSSRSQASENLSRCLANRLQAKTDELGSTLYNLTWKEKVTPAGRVLPWLVASGRRTKDSDSTSWPTPKASDSNKGIRSVEGGLKEVARGKSPDLPAVATLTSWASPTTRDHKDGSLCRNVKVNCLLGREAWLTHNYAARLTVGGEMLIGSLVETESTGRLDPEHSLWLMGLPIEYDVFGEQETPSASHRREPLSRHLLKSYMEKTVEWGNKRVKGADSDWNPLYNQHCPDCGKLKEDGHDTYCQMPYFIQLVEDLL